MNTFNTVVFKFSMGDVDDPDIYAAQSIMQWQSTESGKWIMDHALYLPKWERYADPYQHGWTFTVRATLSPENYTFWKLKYA